MIKNASIRRRIISYIVEAAIKKYTRIKTVYHKIIWMSTQHEENLGILNNFIHIKA